MDTRILLISALLAPAVALAQDVDEPPPDDGLGEEPWLIQEEDERGFSLLANADDEHLATPMGVALLIGGGSMNLLTDRDETATRTGGSWHARGVLGTRSVVAGELAYLGSANRVAAEQGLPDGSVLLSNGGEAAVRVQAPITVGAGDDLLLEPFATAGVAVLAHDLARTNGETALEDGVTVHVPLAGGFAVATSGFIADARLTYRPTIDDTSIFGTPTPFDNAMDGLAVTGSVGLEF